MPDNRSSGIVNTFGHPLSAASVVAAPATIDYDAGVVINQELWSAAGYYASRDLASYGNVFSWQNPTTGEWTTPDALKPYIAFDAEGNSVGPVRWVPVADHPDGGYLYIDPALGNTDEFKAAVDAAAAQYEGIFGRDVRGGFSVGADGQLSFTYGSYNIGSLGEGAYQEAFEKGLDDVRATNMALQARGFRPSIDLNFTELGGWRSFELNRLRDYVTNSESEFEEVHQLNVFKPGFGDAVAAVVHDASDLGFTTMSFNMVAERMTFDQIAQDDEVLSNVLTHFLPSDVAGAQALIDRLQASPTAFPAGSVSAQRLTELETILTSQGIDAFRSALYTTLSALPEDYNVTNPHDPAVLNTADARLGDLAILNAIRPHQEAYDLAVLGSDALIDGSPAADLVAYIDAGHNQAFLAEVFNASRDNLVISATDVNTVLAEIRAGRITPGSDAEKFLDALKHAIPMQAALEEHRRINTELTAAGQPPIALTGHFMESIYHYGLGDLQIGDSQSAAEYLQHEVEAGRFHFSTENYSHGYGLDGNIFPGDITVGSLLTANANSSYKAPVVTMVDLASIDGAINTSTTPHSLNPAVIGRFFDGLLNSGVIPIASTNPDNLGFGDQLLQGALVGEYLAAVDAYYDIEANANKVAELAPNNADMPGFQVNTNSLAMSAALAAIDAKLHEFNVTIDESLYNRLLFGEHGLFTALSQTTIDEHFDLNVFIQENNLPIAGYHGYLYAVQDALVAGQPLQDYIIANAQGFAAGNTADIAAPTVNYAAQGLYHLETEAQQAAWSRFFSNASAMGVPRAELNALLVNTVDGATTVNVQALKDLINAHSILTTHQSHSDTLAQNLNDAFNQPGLWGTSILVVPTAITYPSAAASTTVAAAITPLPMTYTGNPMTDLGITLTHVADGLGDFVADATDRLFGGNDRGIV